MPPLLRNGTNFKNLFNFFSQENVYKKLRESILPSKTFVQGYLKMHVD